MCWIIGIICLFAFLPTAAFSQDQTSTQNPPAQSAAPDPSLKLVRIDGNVLEGNLIKRVDPVYPQIARTAHISGTVVLHVIVGTDGTVQDVTYVSGPPLLLRSALVAVQQWQYKPVLLNGDPVRVDSTLTVVFCLGCGSSSIPHDVGATSSGVPPSTAEQGTQVPDSTKSTPDSTDAVDNKHAEPPVPIKQVRPKYPKDAKKAGISGTVILHATIDTEGRVKDLTYVSGPAELRQSAMDAVQKWRYKPRLLDGKPATADLTITLNFSL
jgi:TonB family protein